MGRLNVTVPDELHKEIRVAAAEQDKTIAEFVTAAIEEKLKSDKQNEDQKEKQ